MAAQDAVYANLAEVARRNFAVAAVRDVKRRLDANREDQAPVNEISPLE